MKILYLDRNESFRSSVRSALRAHYNTDDLSIDFPVDLAHAMKMVKSIVYDIIISEYYPQSNIKGIDSSTGRDFFERLRLEVKIPWSTSVIILTTKEEKQKDVEKILCLWELYVDEYLYKNEATFTPDFFLWRLEKLVNKKNQLRPLYMMVYNKKYIQAIDVCKKARGNKDIARIEMVCYLEKQDYEGIINMYNEIINSWFKNISETGWFNYFYAKALFELWQYKKAQDISQELKRRFPNFLENYELLAQIYHAEWDSQEAIKVLKEACTQSSLNMERQKYLSEIALLSWNLPVAKESLAKIVTDGQNSCVHSLDDFAHLAHIEWWLWNYDEALKVISDWYDRFSKSDSSAKMVTAVLESQVFAKKWDLNASKSAFEVAMGEYKKNPWVEISPDMQLYFWAECLEHGEKDLWKQMISSGIGDSPKKYQIEKHLERVLRWEENMKILSQLVDDIENEWETLFEKAMKRAKSWDYKKAISILIQQKEVEPTNPLNYIQISMMMLFSIENSIKTLADDDFEYENQLEHAKSFINLSERYINDSNKSDYLREKWVIEMFLKRLEKKRQEQKLENEKEKNKLQASWEETWNGLDGLDDFIL